MKKFMLTRRFSLEAYAKNLQENAKKCSLTHFSPVSHFYTPWKRQKTFGFSDVFRGYRNVTLD